MRPTSTVTFLFNNVYKSVTKKSLNYITLPLWQMTGSFPSQRDSSWLRVSKPWHHHVAYQCWVFCTYYSYSKEKCIAFVYIRVASYTNSNPLHVAQPPHRKPLMQIFHSRDFISMGLLPGTLNCGLRMRRECRERFIRHQLQRKPLISYHGTCITHVPLMHGGTAN